MKKVQVLRLCVTRLAVFEKLRKRINELGINVYLQF